MNRNSRPKAPLRLPYILIKTSEKPDDEPKKILLPKSINDLHTTAIKVLKIQNVITEIRTENNKLVQTIEDISPGEIVQIISEVPKPKKKIMSQTKASQVKSPHTNRVARVFGCDVQESIIQQNKKNIQLDTTEDSLSEDEIIVTPIKEPKKTESVQNENHPPKKSNLPVFHSTKTQEEKEISEYNDNEEYEIDDPESPPKNYYDISNTILSEHAQEEEEEDNSERNEESDSIIKIFDDALPSHELDNDIQNILYLLPQEYTDFLKKALVLENQQRDRWVTSLMRIANECGISYKRELIECYDQIKEKTLSIIQDHFFATPCGCCSTNKTIIEGPSQSGKSTMLAILLNQYLYTIASNNMWKKSFLIILNCEDFSFYASDVKLLYLHYIKITIEHLSAQVPEASAYATILQRYFTSIVENTYLPTLPKKFSENPSTSKIASACKSVASLLSQGWNSPDGRECFCTLIFMMPILIAKNIGFTDITLIVDHFDLLNIVIDETLHFPESTGELFLIEHFKNALIQTNFVVSCKDSDEMYQCLFPFDESAFDLTQIVSFVSTLDIDSNAHYENYEFSFIIQDITYKINAQHFGGVPSFLKKWTELNEYMDEVEDTEIDSEDYEEKYANVVNHMQSIIPIIFMEEGKYVNISDIKRKQIQKKR